MTSQLLRLMGEAAKPLVITSINPYGDMEWQKDCIDSFTSTGHDLVSLNTEKEANSIRPLGFNAKICTISPEQTGLSRYGKPVPLIKEALNYAYQCSARNYYILTNADIFYAGNRPCNRFAHSISQAFAFTRVDVLDNKHSPSKSWKTYRGGLDIFGFTRNALKDCIEVLENYSDVADLMAYGIPGWDFLVGSIVLGPLKGYCMDGTVFQHKIHQQTYNSPAALQPFVSTINKLGHTDADTSEDAAHQFACEIDSQCTKNLAFSRLLRSAFYCQKHRRKAIDSHPKEISVNTKENEDCPVASTVSLLLHECYHPSELIKLKGLLMSPRISDMHYYPAVRDTFVASDSNTIKTRKHILVGGMLLSSITRKTACCFSDIYPKGNSHSAAVKYIYDTTDPVKRAYQFTELFYSELIEHKIYNQNVAKYILAHLDDARYRHLMCQQIDLIRRHFNHA